jgi:chaperonin cofactor prefoldin
MAAEGLIIFEQLRTKLASQEEARKTAERELEALSRLSEPIEQLERDREALMNCYVGAIPPEVR